MPEMLFHIRWPDGTDEMCYSPSLVIKDHLVVDTDYPLTDFLLHIRVALHQASERVRAKYGMPCSRALEQLSRIEQKAVYFSYNSQSIVTVIAFEE